MELIPTDTYTVDENLSDIPSEAESDNSSSTSQSTCTIYAISISTIGSEDTSQTSEFAEQSNNQLKTIPDSLKVITL